MGFHHRKLLHQHHHYLAPTEATMASPTPSPSVLPLLFPRKPKPWLPLPPLVVTAVDHIKNHEHVHVLQVAMIVMACMVGMVMFLCTMSIILRRYYSRRHNHNNNSRRRNTPILFDVNGDSPVVSDDEGPIIEHPIWFIRTEGLQQSLIDSITVFRYRKEEGLIDGTECSVCLGEFEQEDSLRLLPKCSHAFHIPCIDTWLRSHKNCPLCRAPVAHSAGDGNGSSNSSTEVRATEPDSNVSDQNQETQAENFDGGEGYLEESESSAVRIIGDDDSDRGDSEIPDKILPNSDKVNCHASVLIGSHEVEEEIQPMRRSVSMDSSSASMIFRDVVEFNSDQERSDTQLDDKINSSSKAMIIAKQGNESSSSAIYKLASIGRSLQKKPVSFRGSFSHNRKFLFSRHCRSQSSTLPL